jgi:hypothetical protein
MAQPPAYVPLFEGTPNVLANLAQQRMEQQRTNVLAEESSRRDQREQWNQNRLTQQDSQEQAAQEEKQRMGRLYAGIKGNIPGAWEESFREMSETFSDFAGLPDEQKRQATQVFFERTLGIEPEKPAPGPIAFKKTPWGGQYAEQDGQRVPGLEWNPPAPPRYGPAGYREVTIVENGKPMVYMVNERNPSQKILMGEGTAKGSGSGGGVTVDPETGALTVNPDPAKATEGERTSSNYYGRMEAAEAKLGNSAPSAKDYIASANVMAGGAVRGSVANQYLSPEGQLYYQAAADWVRAKLRKESGAVISQEEMAQEIKTYFPLPGDKPATIEQKRQARKQAMEGMRQMGGRAVQPAAPANKPKGGKFTVGKVYTDAGGNNAVYLGNYGGEDRWEPK